MTSKELYDHLLEIKQRLVGLETKMDQHMKESKANAQRIAEVEKVAAKAKGAVWLAGFIGVLVSLAANWSKLFP